MNRVTEDALILENYPHHIDERETDGHSQKIPRQQGHPRSPVVYRSVPPDREEQAELHEKIDHPVTSYWETPENAEIRGNDREAVGLKEFTELPPFLNQAEPEEIEAQA
jgi:hypothetical protein